MTRRSTRTITVLSQAWLTTTPCRTRFGILLRSRRRLAAPLAENGFDARNLAPHLAHPRGVFELAAGALESQVEDFLAQIVDLFRQLVVAARAQVRGPGTLCAALHAVTSSACLVTKRVPIGSFAAANSNASRAISGVTPSSSNMMRPGLTRQTQNSGDPLPLPMRTSAGFEETGPSGKMRIQTRPLRRIVRVIVRRAASIWRAVMRPGATAFRPKAPKLRVVPPLAMPWMRPLWALRYFVRFGESISIRPYGRGRPDLAVRRGHPARGVRAVRDRRPAVRSSACPAPSGRA